MKILYLKLAIMLAFFFVINCQAQPQKNFKHYTINDGLSQNTVFSILADKEGFIWIGTEDGLNKFDGYEFTTYRNVNNDNSTISNNQINALLEDKFGNIWVATAKGLNVYDRKKDRFIRVGNYQENKDSPGEYITSLSKDKLGNIWIGSLSNFKKFDLKTKKLTIYKSKSIKGKDLNRVLYVFNDERGLLWFSNEKGIKIFNPNTNHFVKQPLIISENAVLKKGFVRKFNEDQNGNIWIGTEFEGAFIYNTKLNTLKNLRYISGSNSLPTNNAIRDIFIKNNDEVWFATREGLSVYRLSTNKFTNYLNDKYNPNSISHNIIRCISPDNSGNCWIGTYSGGLNMITASNDVFSSITEDFGTKPGLSSKVVNAVANANNGGLWVGTESRGLNFIDGTLSNFKTVLFTDLLPKTSNTVKALLKDGELLWIGTLNSLWCLNTKTLVFKNYPIPEGNSVYSLEKTPEGIWIGTNGAGVILLDPNKGYTKTLLHGEAENTIISNHITKLCKDNKNNLWIATPAGLNYYDGKKIKLYQYNENNNYSISNSSIQSVFVDRNNRIWIGTKGGGLNFFDQTTQRFYAITTKNGLSNDVIQAIKEDQLGNLWVSSNKGLSKISFSKFKIPFKDKDYKIANYYFEDGLQSNQFNTNSSVINHQGYLFFGGINGITYFNPQKIPINQYKPPIAFTEFQIRNKKVQINDENSPLKTAINETQQITLTHDEAYFSIKFAALNYINPNKSQYLYKLEGLKNEDWHLVNNQRIATYTNLDEGDYYFKVKASNNDGIWNEHIKILKITILPPWWKTWWALLIYALIIASLLYLYYLYSLKTAKLKNDLFYEHLIREKDQELYQQKLNFFTNISHEIKTPITLILAPLEKLIDQNHGNNKVNKQLMMMKRNGERLIRLISELLDFRQFESGSSKLQVAEGNIVRFIKEVTFAFQSYANHLNINLIIRAEESSIRLWFDRDKFEKIMYNLISNALKFTRPEGEILITIKRIDNNETLQIEVIDDGIGISEKNIPYVFDQFTHYNEEGANNNGTGIGLNFSKILVELHKGKISVESKQSKNGEKGFTCFRLVVPLGNSHFKTEEIINNYKNSEDITAYEELDIDAGSSFVLNQKRDDIIKENKGDLPILLLVEDNHDVLSFLMSHFGEKFEIHTARNGKEGLDKAFEIIPDLIVSDVMMPEISGIIMCDTLKKDVKTSHIPIILLTARTPIIYKIEGFETGADDYITKPFSIKVLETRIYNLLSIRQKLRDRYKKEVTLEPSNIAISSPDEILFEKIMQFIEKNISDPKLSVEELGKQVYMSRVTLYRKIKALTNQTPVEFIRTIRLKRAAQLLATQKYNINEVAYMVGFLDLNYFRRCFKEEFGKTPKKFGDTNSLG